MRELREAVIDPPQPSPLRERSRYRLSPYTLGKLEALAGARYEIASFTTIDFIGRDNLDEAALSNIAQE